MFNMYECLFSTKTCKKNYTCILIPKSHKQQTIKQLQNYTTSSVVANKLSICLRKQEPSTHASSSLQSLLSEALVPSHVIRQPHQGVLGSTGVPREIRHGAARQKEAKIFLMISFNIFD